MKIEIVARPSVLNGDRSRLVLTPENEQERNNLLPALLALFGDTLIEGKVPRVFHYAASEEEGGGVSELKLDFEFSKTYRVDIDGLEPNEYHSSGKHEVAMVALDIADLHSD